MQEGITGTLYSLGRAFLSVFFIKFYLIGKNCLCHPENVVPLSFIVVLFPMCVCLPTFVKIVTFILWLVIKRKLWLLTWMQPVQNIVMQKLAIIKVFWSFPKIIRSRRINMTIPLIWISLKAEIKHFLFIKKFWLLVYKFFKTHKGKAITQCIGLTA